MHEARFDEPFPYIVTEVKEAVAVGVGFGNVEIGAEKRNEQGVEEVVNEFVEYFEAFRGVGKG